MGTSHSPSRKSREGFGAGLLKSRWGEAKSRDVNSWVGGSQILLGVGLGRLIKPPDFRVVPARCGSWILIGRWDGKLCQGRRVKLWGCSTEVLLISGQSLAADLAWVALQWAEFLLAGCAAGVVRSAWRDAEFWLAVHTAFLLLLLLDFWRLGGWEEAPEDGIKMACVGAGETSVVGRRDAAGAGSTTHFTRLS